MNRSMSSELMLRVCRRDDAGGSFRSSRLSLCRAPEKWPQSPDCGRRWGGGEGDSGDCAGSECESKPVVSLGTDPLDVREYHLLMRGG